MNIRNEENKLLNCFVVIILLIVASFSYLVITGFNKSIEDKEPPTIKILENDLFFYDTEEINFLDYVEVKDNSEEYEVKIIDEEKSKLPGIKKVGIEATDLNGNTNKAYLDVEIVSLEKWKEHIIEITNGYKYRRQENVEFENEKGIPDYDMLSFAETFIGMPGACNEVAQAFIDAYFGEGYNIFDSYPIEYEDALPGDIIYYTDGGLGEQHYATYLGGSSALQGNIYGTTVIGSVYMNYGSVPQFYRINGR